MAQKFFSDKILGLSYSAGVITLGSGSILTIGGQQYTLSANITLTLPTLTGSTLYYVYAVASNGVVSLVQSTNVNSVGPVSQNAWKLVGAYYSNGITGSIAFGSFVNIEGAPKTQRISFTPTLGAGFSGPSGFTFTWHREGNDMVIYGTFSSGTVAASLVSLALPGAFTLDSTLAGGNTTAQAGPTCGIWTANTANPQRTNAVTATGTSSTLIYAGGPQSSTPLVPATGSGAFASSVTTAIEARVPISGFDNKPLRDL